MLGTRDDFQDCEGPYPICLSDLTYSKVGLILWELPRNPDRQTKLRTELDVNLSAKGNADFAVAELENSPYPYLNPVIETSSSIRREHDGID